MLHSTSAIQPFTKLITCHNHEVIVSAETALEQKTLLQKKVLVNPSKNARR